MAEISALSQIVQIGVEANNARGTAVAATKRLQSVSIRPGIKVKSNRFRPQGQKYASLVTLGKEWSEAAIAGAPTYDELLYLLGGVFCEPVSAAIMDGATPTTAHRHTFEPSSTLEDVIKSFTVESGNASRARRFAYGLISEFGLRWNREDVEVSGMMLGRRHEENQPLTTTGVTTLPLVPMQASEVDVFLDNTSAGLGTTKLSNVKNGAFSIKNRFGPAWNLNSALTSFSDHVEREPGVDFSLRMTADAVGMALLDTMRAGDTRFIRTKWTGPQIYNAGAQLNLRHSFDLDVAVKVQEPKRFEDADGVYAIEWTFEPVHDATWGRAFKAVLVNKTAALN